MFWKAALKEYDQLGEMLDGLSNWLNDVKLLRDRQMDVRVSPDLLTLPIVSGLDIELVLHSLIDNAVKYSGAGSPITLTIEREGEEWLFSVADRGIGIAADEIDRIWKPRYRVKREGVPGSGLGLAVCKRIIVKEQGGRIWVDSTPGVGSCFYFRLPMKGRRI